MIAALALATALPAHALVNGTDTTSFSAVGELGGASGVQIAENWVLTAAHVANGLVADASTFQSVAGSSMIDAVYTFSNTAFPNNDVALVHLSTAISSALPVLNDVLVSSAAATKLGSATIASAQNQTPNGYGVTTAKNATTLDTENGVTSTVNWLITQGGAYVQGGDSGGALFKGTPTDSGGSVLLGVASASLSYTTGGPASAFAQTAAYKSWINSTMASSGQQATWSSTPIVLAPSVVPEPSTAALFALCGLAALASKPVRRRLSA
jgi:hypothetical protein